MPHCSAARKMVSLCQVAFISLCMTNITEAAAQEAKVLPVEAGLRMRYVSEYAPVSFSGDGKWLAYAARDNAQIAGFSPEEFERTGIPTYGSGANIYVVALATGEVRNLTQQSDNWLPTWSPDGRLLAFLSDRDGSGQARLWLWDAKADQLRRASEKNIRGAKIVWLLDSSGVIVGIAPDGRASEQRNSQSPPADSLQNRSDKTSGMPGSTVKLYQADLVPKGSSEPGSAAPWNLDRYLADLAFVDLRHGDQLKIIVRGGRISTFSLSPDGAQVAYTIPKRFERSGSQQILFDLRLVSTRDNQQRALASDIHLNIGGDAFRWSPDGLWIAFIAGGMEETRLDCYAIELATGRLHNLTTFSPSAAAARSSLPIWDSARHVYFLIRGELWRATIGQSQAAPLFAVSTIQIKQLVAQPENTLWSPDAGKSTIVLAHDTVTGHDGFYRIDLNTGLAAGLAESGHCYTCAVRQSSVWVAPDGQSVAFTREDAGTPSDLWIADSRMTGLRRLTTLNPQLSGIDMGQTRLVDWLGADGQKLRGTLLLPPHYDEGVRYPLIVWVYGGASGSNYLDTFGIAGTGPFNMQFLATRGYAILFPDAPQALGTPMSDLAKTVLPGINELVRLGVADPDHVGVMGHSYGGYSTLSLIVQTKRFAAAVEADGMGDLIGSYGGMDAAGSAYGTATEEHGQGLMGGTPWQFRDRYIENSPVSYLDRVSTPLLIVQGDADSFVPSFLADQVFVGLRRLGREAVYAKYHGENHDPGVWTYANQVDLSYRIIDWFDNHLKVSANKKSDTSTVNRTR